MAKVKRQANHTPKASVHNKVRVKVITKKF